MTRQGKDRTIRARYINRFFPNECGKSGALGKRPVSALQELTYVGTFCFCKQNLSENPSLACMHYE